jgi:nitrogen fixation protein FixH
MKFNWGTGIFLVYTLFAVVLFWFVYQSTKHDHSLVVDNYYEQDLQYQQQFERMQRANSLSAPVKVQFDQSLASVVISFPEEVSAAQGSIHFYRPSDQRFDFRVDLAVDEAHRQLVPVQAKLGGRWIVKILWEEDGREYYVERDLVLPQL